MSGYVGRSVKVLCSYHWGHEDNEKYLCRNDCGYSDVLITTSEKNKEKYCISDDKNKKVFTVTISDLNLNDTGKYWCGISNWFQDDYTEVKLDVKQGKY